MQSLEKEIDDKALFLCPFFYMEIIQNAIDSLPDYVKVDNIQFSLYHSAEYIDGIKRMVPVNIRHVVPPKPITNLQEIINNDPGQYQWN